MSHFLRLQTKILKCGWLDWLVGSERTPGFGNFTLFFFCLLHQTFSKPLECVPLHVTLYPLYRWLQYLIYFHWVSSASDVYALPSFLWCRSLHRLSSSKTQSLPLPYNLQQCVLGVSAWEYGKRGNSTSLVWIQKYERSNVFQSGGPITWKTEHQDRTSLSSCKAGIRATNAGSRCTMNVRNMMSHLSSLGYPITDMETATTVFNNNEACIKWCHNMTT